jgi:hypothetical protein
MKKVTILMIVLMVISGSCQKSQFSTTTRYYRNGKATYENRYYAEHNRMSRGKNRENRTSETEQQKSFTADDRTKLKSATGSRTENTAFTPVYSDVNGQVTSMNNHHGFKMENSSPDTLKIDKKEKTTPDISGTRILKFKNGNVEVVKKLSLSNDTLRYQLISESDIVRSVLMEKVDSILPDTRKSQPLAVVAFVSSLLGLVPLFGLPFACLGVVLGLISLKKWRYQRNTTKYKGKGLARAAVWLGVLGFLISIVVLICLAANSCSRMDINLGT